MACARFRRILVSASERLHGWSVITLHDYWRAVLKCAQHTTGSHTQPWFISSRIDAINIILRCAHVQQGVWCRSVFPTVSCLPYWKQITGPVCEANTNMSFCWRHHLYITTYMDHSPQCFCTVCHSLTLQILQGIYVNASMLVSNAQPSATVKSRALIKGLILCLRSLLPHTSGWERWSQSFTEMRSIEVKDEMIIARGLMCEATMTQDFLLLRHILGVQHWKS